MYDIEINGRKFLYEINHDASEFDTKLSFQIAKAYFPNLIDADKYGSN